jgi:DNA gyrase subunit A
VQLAPLAMQMLRDIDEDTVDFRPNYDGRRRSPTSCPPVSPTCSSTAAPASPSAWPRTSRRTTCVRSLQECAGTSRIRPRRPRSCSRRCSSAVKGPDFPTGALIVGHRGIEDAYRTGRGSITMRSVVEVEEINNRTCLVVTELPYQVNPDNLAMKIADLVKDAKIGGIADVRDEGNERLGQRLVIVLKRDAVAKVVLNNLYKHTQLQDNFSANMLALVDGVPRTLSLDAFVRTGSSTRSTSSAAARPTCCARRRSAPTSCAATPRRSTSSTR